VLFVGKSASLNRTMKGSASSVPCLMKTVSTLVVTEVVFHSVYDEVVAESLALM
jgi:hypothetical protein